jgi:hypothetical protein
MDGTEDCPWDVSPSTVEGMLASCNAQKQWEAEHGGSAPYMWCIIPTITMFGELCRKVIELEQATNG